MADRLNFYKTINEAIADISKHGYDSQERLAHWLAQIRLSAMDTLRPLSAMQNELRATFQTIFTRMTRHKEVVRFHPGVTPFTIERVKPKLRLELERRTAASMQLIKLNREAMLQKTEQRFSGWASSVPPGGSKAVDKPEVRQDLRKALTQLPFEERRVAIDQGHKFVSELNNIIAVDGGAIAAEWHSHWHQAGYNYRPDHKERDKRVYLVRGNWASEKGLVKPGPAGYTDQITKPGEEVFCRCYYRYIYNLRNLPADMLTVKGRETLEKVRIS